MNNNKTKTFEEMSKEFDKEMFHLIKTHLTLPVDPTNIDYIHYTVLVDGIESCLGELNESLNILNRYYKKLKKEVSHYEKERTLTDTHRAFQCTIDTITSKAINFPENIRDISCGKLPHIFANLTLLEKQLKQALALTKEGEERVIKKCKEDIKDYTADVINDVKKEQVFWNED